ncbi:MAG: tRNA uridine(34) 5-carboxymethylaminomethyl modification radical SAM/GNAT enzyme Elp3 [Candidatus Micrarchaeota archaeon]
MKDEQAAKEAAEFLEAHPDANLEELKKRVSAKYKIKGVVKNSLILQFVSEKNRKKLIHVLQIRPMRTGSGVATIAVMTKSDCPHGRCLYCPRGENAPQSYTGREPAAMRAAQNDFDPYKQVSARLRQLHEIGHETSKCELIIMGGTFNAQPKKYKEWFVKGCFEGLNKRRAKTIAEAQEENEKAKARAVGLTIETRPDWCKQKHVDEMLSWGATRVELGVQTLSDAVYRKVNRGHTVADVVEATRVCKDSGLKVCYHMMPGLFADKKKDVAMFRKLFSDARFMPDMLKIYPCMVLKGTELYEMWKRGEYEPYDSEEAADVIASATKHIPKFARVMRMQRDIPVQLIEAGVKKSNLQQLVEAKLEARGEKCACIRCREAGLKKIKQGLKTIFTNVKLERIDYKASGGHEIFLSYVDKKNDALIGFLRLRVPFKPHRKEITKDSALVRELHVYGVEVMVGGKAEQELQHRGYGARLLKEAERIASKEYGKKKLVVISGIGAREYYYKRAYKRECVYVSKRI